MANAAEIYDPATGSSTPTASMHFARTGCQATVLGSGQVLVSGGKDANGQLVSRAEIYDAASRTWTVTGALNVPRFQHAAVRLADGRVLVAGGAINGGAAAEIFDPATGAFTFTAPMAGSRDLSMGVALPDGRVLIAGVSNAGLTSIDSEIYDPDADAWSLRVPVPLLDQTALGGLVALNNGTPRLTSCSAGRTTCGSGPAALFDVQANAWTLTPPSGSPGDLVALPDGRALGLVSVVSGASFTAPPGGTATVVVRLSGPASFQAGFNFDTLEFRSNGNWARVSLSIRAGVDLTGRIADSAGKGLPGIPLDIGGPTPQQAFTDDDGRYRVFVPLNGSVTVTPVNTALVFTPGTRRVDVGTADVAGVDFTTTLASDLAAFVASLYDNILGRPFDARGLQITTSSLHPFCVPLNFRSIVFSFFDSDEFRRSRPFTLAQLVTILYRGVLGRDPDPDGGAGYADVFRADRRALAIVFPMSPEFRDRLPDRSDRARVTALVTRFYTEFLGRPPDPASLSGWVETIVATGNVEGVAAAFVTSPEFEVRALTFADFVTLLYRGILGRSPDRPGLEAFEAYLRSTLRAVVDSFIASEEFRQRMSRLCGS